MSHVKRMQVKVLNEAADFIEIHGSRIIKPVRIAVTDFLKKPNHQYQKPINAYPSDIHNWYTSDGKILVSNLTSRHILRPNHVTSKFCGWENDSLVIFEIHSRVNPMVSSLEYYSYVESNRPVSQKIVMDIENSISSSFHNEIDYLMSRFMYPSITHELSQIYESTQIEDGQTMRYLLKWLT